MSTDATPSTAAQRAAQLLSLDSAHDRADLLRAAGQLNPEGLAGLLQAARQLIAADATRAIELAAVVREAAGAADAPLIEPQADLLAAQAHAESGRPNTAWTVLESARAAFTRLGDDVGALRTNLGLMHVLTELGKPDDALEAGQTLLRAVRGPEATSLGLPYERAQSMAGGALLNSGVCYEMTGRFEEALAAYDEAEAIYGELGVRQAVADARLNRGVVLQAMGRGSDALASLRSAAEIFDADDDHVPYARALTNIGYTHLHLGDYGRALEAFEDTRQILEPRGLLSDSPILLVDRADALLALNQVSEALSAYRDAERILHGTGAMHHRARALWGMGIALTAQAELERAENALVLAGSLFDASNNRPLLAGVMLDHAALLDATGDRPRARALARDALDRVSGEHWPVQQALAHLRMAELVLPDETDAEMHLSAAERAADRVEVPQLTFRLNQRFGHLRRIQGRDDEARRHLEAAADEIDRARGTLADQALRQSFLQDKHAVYEELTELYLEDGGADSLRRAFQLIEGAKSLRLCEVLIGQVTSRVEHVSEPDAAARLVRLQADLGALRSELLGEGRADASK